VKRTRLAAVLGSSALGALGIAAAAALAGCPSNAAPSLYSPITGMIIDSATLLQGVGCGTDPDQVYKYAAVVTLEGDATSQLPGLPVSGVFDCFTNGELSNLPTFDGGTTEYSVAIYAFNYQTFPASHLGMCVDLGADASCQGEDPKTVAQFASTANWTTTCTAIQVPGVSEVANCGSLVSTSDGGAGDATVTDGEVDGSTEDGEASMPPPADGSSEGGEGGPVEGGPGPESGTPVEAGPDGGSAGDAGTD
jgi:hypothetical protein